MPSLDGCKAWDKKQRVSDGWQRVTRKKLFAFLLLAAAASWATYAHISRTRREREYRAKLAVFQRELSLGSSHDQVIKYLRDKNVAYHATTTAGHPGTTLLIQIGEGPDSPICDWNVYIALEFGANDTLEVIHVSKIGTCI